VEVKRRKVRDFRQALKVQVLIQMLIDVLGYPMHAIDIHIAALERAHRFAVRRALRLAFMTSGFRDRQLADDARFTHPGNDKA
jgi:hypothetical protein